MRLGPVARRVLLAGWCALACLAPCATLQAAPGYQYFRVGNPNDVTATPAGGLALMGGGLDIDAAFAWMNGRSGGGDFLVIRASGTDAYNQWVYDNRYVTLARDFLALPHMAGTLTDSHFAERDRMGRFVGFLARLINDGWTSSVKGIALDSQTAFLVLPDGSGTLEGPPATRAAYFFTTPGAPEVCQPKTPLTYRNLTVYKASGHAGFDLSNWNGSGGTTYTVSGEAGVLFSTQAGGSPY